MIIEKVLCMIMIVGYIAIVLILFTDEDESSSYKKYF